MSTLLLIVVQCLTVNHGGDYPRPDADDHVHIAPPMPNSDRFVEALAAGASALLTEDQMSRLDEAVRHLGFAQAIRDGRYPEATEQDVSFNRWRAERIVLDLLEDLGPDIMAWDFRPDASLPDPEMPVPFHPQTQMVLLKVVTGQGPVAFAVQDVDLRAERYANPFAVPVQDAGVTYVLLNVSDVPTGKSSTQIAFHGRENEQLRWWHALTLHPAPVGQLRVELRDEAGAITPVLLRLVARESGRLWAPVGAVDLRPMLNDVTGMDIYGPGRAYTIPVPGRWSGHYWVIAKPFEMALPPGQWEITLYRGNEYVPVSDVVSVKPAEWTRKVYQLERWVNMADEGWYSGDDHVHARLMSSEDAEKLMAFAQAMDIRVSNILEMGDSERTYYVQRGYGPDFRVEDRGHWLVPGQEDPRSMLGHNIALNIPELVRDLDCYLLLDWVANEVHRQGGLFGQTHVGEDACEAHRGMALLAPRGLYDFYSVLQWKLGTGLYYDFLDLGYKLTASAGTDMPYGGTLGHVRLYAYTGTDNPFTPDAWFDAIEAGRTFVTNGPVIELRVEDAIPGDEITLEEDCSIEVHARVRGLPGDSAPVELEIVRNSDVIAAQAGTLQDRELTLDVTVEAGYGGWIAARAKGANGSAAHTTPVYLTRTGFRRWNTDRVKPVVARQCAVLDEIEGVIRQAEILAHNDQLAPNDFWNRRIVEQAEPVRERLGETRAIYEDLLRELEAEMVRR